MSKISLVLNRFGILEDDETSDSLVQDDVDDSDDSIPDDDTDSNVFSKISDFAYHHIDKFTDSEGNIDDANLEGLINGAVISDPSLLDDMKIELQMESVEEFIEHYGDEIKGMVSALSLYGPDIEG